VIDLDGEDGALANTHRLSMPGPGGYPGGAQAIEAEGVGTIAEQLALGPGAGVHAQYPGGAGHAVRGGGNSTYGTLGRAYGNELLIPLLGGSGGSPSGSQGGGGAGGGALLIASSTSIALNGVISARGGKGGRKLSGTLGGGGGSGGAVHFKAPAITGSGTIDISGGESVVSSSGISVRASLGRVRLEAFDQSFSGEVVPDSSSLARGVPTRPFVPAWPIVRIATIVSITFVSPFALATTVEATLSGTFESSTASAMMTIPGSLSQAIIRYAQP
jgi:hypothetical protein